MQIDAAVQLAIFNDRPTPTANRIVFLLPRPGKFKTWRITAWFHPAIHIPSG